MQKHLKSKLAAAAALMFVGGAAQAQLQIYGLIDMSYGKSLLGEIFLNEKADFHSGGDNGSSEGNSTSRVGMKGAMDVGSGIKANFRLETGGITSDGEVNPGGAFFNRQAWAGFSGSFGEVRLGRQDSVAFQTMIDYDFNGASNGVSALGYALVGPWLPSRLSRSLQYISPTMGGMSFHLGYVPEGNVVGGKNSFSGSLKFADGPLSVAVTAETKRTNAGKNFSSVGGSYDFGAVKVMAGYANGGSFAAGGTGKGYSLGFVAPVAGLNVGMLYGNNSDSALKLKAYEIFVNKEIFKNTYAYAEMGDWKTSLAVNPLDAAAKRDGTGAAVGVIFTF